MKKSAVEAYSGTRAGEACCQPFLAGGEGAMANPKRRHSKARTRKRRSTWKITVPGTVECSHCHEPKLPHRICDNCGYYRGRQVVVVGEEG